MFYRSPSPVMEGLPFRRAKTRQRDAYSTDGGFEPRPSVAPERDRAISLRKSSPLSDSLLRVHLWPETCVGFISRSAVNCVAAYQRR
jgi:hypothetical protein